MTGASAIRQPLPWNSTIVCADGRRKTMHRQTDARENQINDSLTFALLLALIRWPCSTEHKPGQRDACWARRTCRDRAARADRAMAIAAAQPLSASLYAGFTGIAWVAELIAGDASRASA